MCSSSSDTRAKIDPCDREGVRGCPRCTMCDTRGTIPTVCALHETYGSGGRVFHPQRYPMEKSGVQESGGSVTGLGGMEKLGRVTSGGQ